MRQEGMLITVINDENLVFMITVDGDPVAHQRPRFTKTGHTYTPKPTQEYKKKVFYLIPKSKCHKDDKTHFGVQAVFYRSNRQRIDVDNLLKSILDACTMAGVWNDDSQVREIAAKLITGNGDGKATFAVYTIENHSNEVLCLNCKKPLKAGRTTRRYCSYECSVEDKKIDITCSYCGSPFKIPKSFTRINNGVGRKYCSRLCSILAHQQKQRIKGKESDQWKCEMCGGRVSRKEYKVCRGCSMKTRSDPNSNYWKLRNPRIVVQDIP